MSKTARKRSSKHQANHPTYKAGCACPKKVGVIPDVVDLIRPGFKLPVKRKLNKSEEGLTLFRRIPREVNKFAKVEVGNNGQLLMKLETEFKPCFYKLVRWFGALAVRSKIFRYCLKRLTICGYTYRDFNNLMRIRDLWKRHKLSQFRKSVLHFIFSLPRDSRYKVPSSRNFDGRKAVFKRTRLKA